MSDESIIQQINICSLSHRNAHVKCFDLFLNLHICRRRIKIYLQFFKQFSEEFDFSTDEKWETTVNDSTNFCSYEKIRTISS